MSHWGLGYLQLHRRRSRRRRMEALGNNHGFVDGNKRIALTAADVFRRRNCFYIEVEA
jgi:hypothetical protein